MSPTPRQRCYLRAIDQEATRLKYSPSLREIAALLGVSTQSVAAAVRLLKDAGLLESEYATARSMRLTPKGRELLAEELAA